MREQLVQALSQRLCSVRGIRHEVNQVAFPSAGDAVSAGEPAPIEKVLKVTTQDGYGGEGAVVLAGFLIGHVYNVFVSDHRSVL